MQEKQRLKPGAIADAYLIRGIEGVRELSETCGGLDSRQIKRAIESLEKRGANITNLEDWLFNTYGETYRKRSRRSPEDGTVRHYKAQPHGSSEKKTAYAKIPLNTLGVCIGGAIKVEFGVDSIVIKLP